MHLAFILQPNFPSEGSKAVYPIISYQLQTVLMTLQYRSVLVVYVCVYIAYTTQGPASLNLHVCLQCDRQCNSARLYRCADNFIFSSTVQKADHTRTLKAPQRVQKYQFRDHCFCYLVRIESQSDTKMSGLCTLCLIIFNPSYQSFLGLQLEDFQNCMQAMILHLCMIHISI